MWKSVVPWEVTARRTLGTIITEMVCKDMGTGECICKPRVESVGQTLGNPSIKTLKSCGAYLQRCI